MAKGKVSYFYKVYEAERKVVVFKKTSEGTTEVRPCETVNEAKQLVRELSNYEPK